MSAKHTKGPWRIDSGRYGIHIRSGKTIDALGGNLVAQSFCNIDARLIAAAPDLLEALIDCRRALEISNFTQELAVVNAAIARATGEA